MSGREDLFFFWSSPDFSEKNNSSTDVFELHPFSVGKRVVLRTDVKTFFWSSSVSSGKNSSAADVKTFFWFSPVFSGKSSTSAEVKTL